MAAHPSVLAWRVPGTGSPVAAVYGVARSRIRLKRLRSSSSNVFEDHVSCGTASQVSGALAVLGLGGICCVPGVRNHCGPRAVTEILGIEPAREKGSHLGVEDHLSGVLILAREPSRLSINSMTAGDYSRPLRISTFIKRAGLRLLPPQPQKRFPEEVLRRPEVRCEENGGGGL